MSTWGLNQADHTSLGWSSFDEIVWTDFGESGYQLVPNPEDFAQAGLTSINNCCKKLSCESDCGITTVPDQASQILSNAVQYAEHSQEEDFANFIIGKSCNPVIRLLNPSDEEVWNGFNSASVSDTGTSTSKSSVFLLPEEGGEATKTFGVKTDLSSSCFSGICEDDTVYQDSDSSVINRSCFFSFSTTHMDEENVDFFELYHEDANGASIIEQDWGNSNLEDMDKQFQNSIPFFKQPIWSPSSLGIGSSSPGGSFHQISISSPESNELERNSEVCRMKVELPLPSENMESNLGSREQNANEYGKEVVDSKVEQPHKRHLEKTTTVGKNSRGKPHDMAKSRQPSKIIIQDTKPFLQEADEIQKTNQHVASHKELGENSTRQVLKRKNHPKAVPFINENFDFPVTQMPLVTQGSSLVSQQLQQSPQVLMNYQPMQAMLAVEKQQQKLVGHHALAERNSTQEQQQNPLQVSLLPRKFQEIAPGLCAPAPNSQFLNRSLVKNEPAVETRDDSLEANILKQLQSVMYKLDIRTRLCIRDALYRLAGNAVQRHIIVDRKGNGIRSEPLDGAESSSVNYRSSSNRVLADLVEKETNLIDRSIAHLLFHKCYFPMEGSLYPHNLDIPANYSLNSDAVFICPSSWILQTPPSNWGIGVPLMDEMSITPVSNGFAPINLSGGTNSLRFHPA